MTNSSVPDTGRIASEINSLRADVSLRLARLERDLGTTAATAKKTLEALQRLSAEFDRERTVQLAHHRIGELTQQMERRFGDRARARRLAESVINEIAMDAVQSGFIDRDSLREYTTQVALATPGYWLAPAALMFASTYLKDHERYELASRTALPLDEGRTRLFMALALTRADDEKGAAFWLEGYLQTVDPEALDRDFLVLLDAVASGALGRSCRTHAEEALSRWRREMFTDETNRVQVAKLIELFADETPHLDDATPTLAECASDWPKVAEAYRQSRSCLYVADRLREELLGTANGIVTGAYGDGIVHSALDHLVNQQSDDEAALQREIDVQKRIIEYGGDVVRAAEGDRSPAANTTMDLPTLLMHAAFPSAAEHTQLGAEAKRLAVSCARDWITAAGETVSMRSRQRRPADVVVHVGHWQHALPTDPASPVSGKKLAAELGDHLLNVRRMRRTLNVAVVLGCLVLFAAVTLGMPLFVGSGYVISAVLAALLTVGAARLALGRLRKRVPPIEAENDYYRASRTREAQERLEAVVREHEECRMLWARAETQGLPSLVAVLDEIETRSASAAPPTIMLSPGWTRVDGHESPGRGETARHTAADPAPVVEEAVEHAEKHTR
ncbi:hypothetical protein GCM10023224_01950 [Streptomonospora halophila]|uniref:Uncharacterized protein n=1 Tax=Streptomonospora halophila TaxID=427369 RepID=A0ABP9G2L8_9ACTN